MRSACYGCHPREQLPSKRAVTLSRESYEIERQPHQDPGLVRYVCQGEDCRAFGTARFGFTTKEEWISHWNTFHVAVMTQFVCRHAGCGTTFAADPRALDKFLDHITKRRKEDATTGVLPHWRHPILPDTTSLELQPNPYFPPPKKHNEVPQWLGDVKAPPEYFQCRTPEEHALQLRWTFRRIFGRQIEKALIGATEATAKKRQ